MAGHRSAVIVRGLIASCFAVCCFGASAHAATIAVTTTNTTGTASDCTFTDAIAAANSNAVVNACQPGDPEPTLDTIQLPAGTFTSDPSGSYTFYESVDVRGAGLDSTVLNGFSFYTDWGGTAVNRVEFHNQTIATSDLNIYSPLANFTLDHVRLDGVYVYLSSATDGSALSTTFSNIQAINDTTLNLQQSSSNPGNIVIDHSTFTGSGVAGAGTSAITYHNDRANARIDINNSIITGYTTGILNQECSDMVWSPFTMYVTDSMIGGANMQTGIVNNCGHLVINRTTFHDIDGAAIMAWANYQAVNQNDSSCMPQSSSRLEVYNSTFSGINVSGSLDTTYPLSGFPFSATLVTPYIGIVTVDSQVNPTCPSGSQTTDTDITLVHNTFANNTFTTPGSGIVGVRDGTVLRNLRIQNNAIEGAAFSGTFTATGTASVSGNLTTQAYAGPGVFASGFATVADFKLGPLQDNGGAELGIDGLSGHILTMRPLAGSLLIDAVDSAGLAEDQRGVARSLMNRYDVGAVEVTIAEFTTDGGVYVPSSGRLAETGTDVLTTYEVGIVLLLAGCLVPIARRL